MKKLLRKPQTITEKWEIEWIIDIYPKNIGIEASTSILDINSEEYQNFVASMINEFQNVGFELYNDSKYTHLSNTPGSQSDYYTFLRIEDYVIIEVIVHIRISDHPIPDKPWGTAIQRRASYLNKVSGELKDEYELKDYPYTVPVDIIFRDEDDNQSKYLKSYIAAMFKIRSEIKEIQEQIEQLKAQDNK